MKLCPRCRIRLRKPNCPYCSQCHRAYNREWVANLDAERENWKSAEDLTRDNGKLHGKLAKALRENDQLRFELSAAREDSERFSDLLIRFKAEFGSGYPVLVDDIVTALAKVGK